jgi:hypothetical protein
MPHLANGCPMHKKAHNNVSRTQKCRDLGHWPACYFYFTLVSTLGLLIIECDNPSVFYIQYA